MDTLPQEYSCQGNGDFRSTAFAMKDDHGVFGCDLRYKNYKVYKGKYQLPGLPGVYGDDSEIETLEIVLQIWEQALQLFCATAFWKSWM